MANRKAVVTGASRGIGRAIAVALAADGLDVVCVSTREGGCAETLEAIAAAGGTGAAHALDIADAEAVAAFADRVLADGPVHVLVNNAGITRDGAFLRMSDADFDAVLATNLRGAFLMCRAFARALSKADAPRIVNIGSVVGSTGNPGQVNYAASKAGLIGMSKALAKELGGRGVTVNVVEPGFIETDMTAGLPEAVRSAALASIPLRRFGGPEDVATLVRFLCSESAGYVTGQILAVDGGMTM